MTTGKSATREGSDSGEGSSACWDAVSAAAACLLGQCEAFIRDVPDGVYTAASTVLPGGTVGKHVRHVLDHYAAIVAGSREGGVIAYDHRERDVPMETSRAEAMRAVAGIRGEIASMSADPGRVVKVRVMVSGDGLEAEVVSSLARELAFATHHAVHHQAMMRAIAGEFGVEADSQFGKAPSTIQFETASAARSTGVR